MMYKGTVGIDFHPGMVVYVWVTFYFRVAIVCGTGEESFTLLHYFNIYVIIHLIISSSLSYPYCQLSVY